MTLAEYHRKRHFSKTAEPKGKSLGKTVKRKQLSFVIQKHAATRLHFDFRLELDGVLKSWAVPKGPSLNPSEKRLAVAVEDHPLAYAKFEGTIPAGEYGAGEVIVWDRGYWIPDGDPHESLRRGKLEFELQGERLAGHWRLIQIRGREGGKNWLLMKRHDEAVTEDEEITAAETASIVSGRTLDEIAAGKLAVKKTAKRSSRPRQPRSRLTSRSSSRSQSRGEQASSPALVEPQLAQLAKRVPSGDEWIHEIKYDGYRLMCVVANGTAKLFTRRQLDWTHRFASIATAAAQLPVETALLDGEIVALSDNGISNFQALQNSLQGIESQPLAYYIFDLLQVDGEDLRELPLVERKARLKTIVPKSDRGRIRFSDHISGNGEIFLEHGCQVGLEGIISKRGDRPYTSGRSDDWLKIKCHQEEEFVIGGFTISEADKRGFGALLIGYFQGRNLVYAGRVGTGYSAKLLRSLRVEFDRLLVDVCPFATVPARERGAEVRWVRPSLVAQIQFTGWTDDQRLRHPSFLGLREDKTARSVGRPESLDLANGGRTVATRTKQPAKKSGPRKSRRSKSTTDKPSAPAELQVDYPFTNPDRVLYPDSGITKLDLGSYYQQAAEWILPYLEDRPLSLLRCPEGQSKACFFQKHAAAGTPDALRRIEITEKDGPETYLIADNLPGLLSLAQMGVLEIHVWGSRADRLEHPDWFVMDLDPAPEVPWQQVVESAFLLRDFFAQLDLQTFVKVTGGKGLHLVAPLSPRRATWDEVKSFTHQVAQAFADQFPDRYLAKMSKAARRGKIFLDYLRNDRGSTAIAPYSTRAKPAAPISVPLTWKELTADIHSDHWRIENIAERLKKQRDPWEGLFEVKQQLPKLREPLRQLIPQD